MNFKKQLTLFASFFAKYSPFYLFFSHSLRASFLLPNFSSFRRSRCCAWDIKRASGWFLIFLFSHWAGPARSHFAALRRARDQLPLTHFFNPRWWLIRANQNLCNFLRAEKKTGRDSGIREGNYSFWENESLLPLGNSQSAHDAMT